MTTSTVEENKMGIMPVPKLLISMSLPMMLSMLVQALYNIVDSMFVAQLSEDALTAVSLAFPVQNLMISVAAGTGVGINALLSRNLGEKNFEGANTAARNGIFLGVLSYIVFAILGGLGAHLFFRLQTDNPVIINYGTEYMTIICVLSIGIFMQITFSLAFFFNIKKNKDININMRHFRPHKNTISTIYKVGVPSIVMQAISSVMTFGMNKILLMFSSTAAAVFGVYYKLQSFIFMPVFGLNNGMIPIIAYNYGARNKKRITQTIKLSVLIAVAIMLAGLLIFQTAPEFLLKNLFDASEHMIEIGIPALRIISLSFMFAGFCIVASSVFQALGNGVYSLIVSAARQLFVILPLAYTFARLFGLHKVWWAIPIAEIVSLTLCSILLWRIYQLKIKPIGRAD